MYDELTEVDIQKMRDELKYRYEVLAPALGAEVKRTREYGDLSENAEYKVAKQERNKNRSRIRYLEAMIRTAKVIPASSAPDVIGLFDHVTYYRADLDKTKTIQIVTTLRQDALAGFISKESPLGHALLGHALLGHHTGERVTVVVSETKQYELEIVSFEKGEDNTDLPISTF